MIFRLELHILERLGICTIFRMPKASEGEYALFVDNWTKAKQTSVGIFVWRRRHLSRSGWQSNSFDDTGPLIRNIHPLWVVYTFFSGFPWRGEREYVNVAIVHASRTHTQGTHLHSSVSETELRVNVRWICHENSFTTSTSPIYLVSSEETSLKNSIGRSSQIRKLSRCPHATRRTFAMG